MKRKISGALLWFGAAISIAEIMTGAMIAPIGLWKGIIIIVIGHLIGCILFYYVGLIGAKTKKSSMENTALTFGTYGSIFFSSLNIIQLIGWTSIMILSGAVAINTIYSIDATWIFSIIIGAFIIIWIVIGIENITKINIIAVSTLLILCIYLLTFIINKSTPQIQSETISLGLALELSITMPISWLPLVSDYTKSSSNPKTFTFVSTLAYFIGSCFMYIVGLSSALYFGNGNIIEVLASFGNYAIALIIVLLSTVTTTYLDVYSAGISAMTIFKKANAKTISIVVCIIGILLSILFKY